jgi:hypothetical protein
VNARLAQLDRASASGAEGGSRRRPISEVPQGPSPRSRRLARGTAWRDDRCAACGMAVAWAPYSKGGSVALHPEPVPGGKYCLPLGGGNRHVHMVLAGYSRPVYSLAYVGHAQVCGVLK